ncbi:sorbosone dehydrogenase family protein [bacterium]|nr:MAG: sorbosone dehydrogenase family protein [bacterium]
MIRKHIITPRALNKNKDYKADQVINIAKGLNSPNGVAFKDGSLYVAEISKITRYDNIESKLNSVPAPVTITDKLPTETHHGWKYINFGPDGKLYVPVGAPCNICKSDDERFASITRMNADGSNPEVFAHGVRNSVGFDWNPENNSMWFTDNGRDMLGDDVPTDELNMADKAGMNFGYPYCHQGDVSDPQFGSEKGCSEFSKPASKLSPHAAALGMKFYKGNMFPAAYKKKVFIAEHGSWNRKNPIGYRIMTVDVENNKASNYKVFAEGWLTSSDVSGRPVDILNMPDGSILVSDDSANMIYRISYQG